MIHGLEVTSLLRTCSLTLALLAPSRVAYPKFVAICLISPPKLNDPPPNIILTMGSDWFSSKIFFAMKVREVMSPESLAASWRPKLGKATALPAASLSAPASASHVHSHRKSASACAQGSRPGPYTWWRRPPGGTAGCTSRTWCERNPWPRRVPGWWRGRRRLEVLEVWVAVQLPQQRSMFRGQVESLCRGRRHVSQPYRTEMKGWKAAVVMYVEGSSREDWMLWV